MFQQKEIIYNNYRNVKCLNKITECPGKVLKNYKTLPRDKKIKK